MTRLNVKKGKTMHADFHVVDYGNYQIQVNNINCMGLTDTIIIKRQNSVKSFLDFDWILTGCDGFTSSFSKTPMGNVYTKYTVIRNGVSQIFYDTTYVAPFINTTHVINY